MIMAADTFDFRTLEPDELREMRDAMHMKAENPWTF
jgi:hypothetical protein